MGVHSFTWDWRRQTESSGDGHQQFANDYHTLVPTRELPEYLSAKMLLSGAPGGNLALRAVSSRRPPAIATAARQPYRPSMYSAVRGSDGLMKRSSVF